MSEIEKSLDQMNWDEVKAYVDKVGWAAYDNCDGGPPERKIARHDACINAIRQLARPADPAPPQTREEHPDDLAVDEFAVAIKAKLASARTKGRGGWQNCDRNDLWQMLRQHVEKGDVCDIANFCMFIWHVDGKGRNPAVRDAAVRMFPPASGEVDPDFVLVPRVPTKAMIDAANALPCTAMVDNCMIMASVHGSKLPPPGPEGSPLEQWYKAMVAAAPGFTLRPTSSAPATNGAAREDAAAPASPAGERPAPDYLTIGLEAARLHWKLNAATVDGNNPQKIALGKQAVALHRMVAKAAEEQ